MYQSQCRNHYTAAAIYPDQSEISSHQRTNPSCPRTVATLQPINLDKPSDHIMSEKSCTCMVPAERQSYRTVLHFTGYASIQSERASTTDTGTFNPFARLPPELRAMIWQYSARDQQFRHLKICAARIDHMLCVGARPRITDYAEEHLPQSFRNPFACWEANREIAFL